MNLVKILQETDEFAKKRDAATPGEWTWDGEDNDGYLRAEPEHNPIAIFNCSCCENDNSDADATFIAAAKNFDSPSIIRELVDKYRMTSFNNAMLETKVMELIDVCKSVKELLELRKDSYEHASSINLLQVVLNKEKI